jgi:hypothetical protein
MNMLIAKPGRAEKGREAKAGRPEPEQKGE